MHNEVSPVAGLTLAQSTHVLSSVTGILKNKIKKQNQNPAKLSYFSRMKDSEQRQSQLEVAFKEPLGSKPWIYWDTFCHYPMLQNTLKNA